METKYFGGDVLECKIEDRNGVPVGVMIGHLAAFSVDRGGKFGMPDKFQPGAFLRTIQEHKDTKEPVPLRDFHGRTVGGFPIEFIQEDTVGLAVRGEVNLEVQQGREAHSLARQGVIRHFSIGFRTIQDKIANGIRMIFDADLIEGSLVDRPANLDADITEIKAFVDDLRAREIPQEERDAILEAIGVKRMDAIEVKYMDKRAIERALSDSGLFSNRAAKILASRIKDPVRAVDVLKSIKL